jgi:hypothetical protein
LFRRVREDRRSFPARRLAALILLAAAAGFSMPIGASGGAAKASQWGGGALLAQFNDNVSDSFTSGGWSGDLKLPLKIAGAVALTLLILTLAVALYKINLQGKAPPWPVTLYGRCAGVAWFCIFAAAAWIFAEELTLQGPTFWHGYGLRLGVLAVAVLGAIFWMFWWRSEIPEAIKQAEARRRADAIQNK